MLEFLDVKAKLTWLCGGQAAKTFTKQHCGAPLITPFKMVMGHGNLEDGLEYRPEAALSFMPDRLKIIVTSVPFAPIKRGHAGMETRILKDQLLFGCQGIGAAQRISV